MTRNLDGAAQSKSARDDPGLKTDHLAQAGSPDCFLTRTGCDEALKILDLVGTWRYAMLRENSWIIGVTYVTEHNDRQFQELN